MTLSSRGIIGGALGGLVGATIMTAILIASKAAMGLPLLADFMVMGTFVGGAVAAGFAAHYIVGLVDGIIFATIVAVVKALRPTSTGKALALGALYGVIPFILVFIPVLMLGFAPIMMALMGAGAAAMLPTVIALGFVEHLLFGLIVGALVYLFSRGA
ncbi:MAG: hypothetical protein NXY59_00765 [Aigarchaeota archaeon]|nr:hypothetical protein [Candidatus Pelearchaeum maunauluense]